MPKRSSTLITSSVTLRNAALADITLLKDGRIHYTDPDLHFDIFWESEVEFIAFLRHLNDFAVDAGVRG